MEKILETRRRAIALGMEILKMFEGFRGIPYVCPGGYVTIGYGHRLQGGGLAPKNIQKEEAEGLLYLDVLGTEGAVLRNIDVPLEYWQMAALISFTFNVGGAALQRSTLRQKINACAQRHEIEQEFMRWVYCNAKKMRGLEARRRIEAEVYLNSTTPIQQ